MSTVGDNLHSLECGFGEKQRHGIEPNTGSMPRKGLGTSTVPPCAPEPGGPGGSWHSHSIVQVKIRLWDYRPGGVHTIRMRRYSSTRTTMDLVSRLVIGV